MSRAGLIKRALKGRSGEPVRIQLPYGGVLETRGVVSEFTNVVGSGGTLSMQVKEVTVALEAGLQVKRGDQVELRNHRYRVDRVDATLYATTVSLQLLE